MIDPVVGCNTLWVNDGPVFLGEYFKGILVRLIYREEKGKLIWISKGKELY